MLPKDEFLRGRDPRLNEPIGYNMVEAPSTSHVTDSRPRNKTHYFYFYNHPH